jgi:hypothetical protein
MSDRDIVRAARRLRIGVMVTGMLLGLLYLASRLQLGGDSVLIQRNTAGALAPLAGDLMVLLLAAALVPLTRLLWAVEQGQLFSVQVVSLFRSFAMWLMLLAVVSVGAPLVLAFAGGADGHPIALRLNLRDVLSLAVTLLLFLIARLLERARTIEAEMREIV